MPQLNRRHFLKTATAASLATSGMAAHADAKTGRPQIYLFEKSVQSLPPDQLAVVLAEAGFDGIEATIRKGGRISPNNAKDQLPSLVEALAERDLKVGILATDIGSINHPNAREILTTAARLGITQYRLGHWKYHSRLLMDDQLKQFRDQIEDIAKLSRETGMTALIQNHAGSNSVGAPIWDLDLLLDGISPKEVAVAYDIRHAMIEGTTAWATNWRRIRAHIQCVYVKDFIFNGIRAKNVPIGEGVVGKAFYQLLKKERWTGLISIHTPWFKPSQPWNKREIIETLAQEVQQVRERMA